MEALPQEDPLSVPAAAGSNDYFHQQIVAGLVAISWILCSWELYLAFRQRRFMQKHVKRPAELQSLLTAEVYDQSRTYAMDKSSFNIVNEIFEEATKTVFMIYWGMYYCWEWGRDLAEITGLDPNNELYVSAGCFTVSRIISTFLGLPFTIYGIFVLEQRYGFNKQTPGFFVKDQIKKFIVSHIIITPIICGMVWIVKNGGDYFFVYLWLFTLVVSLLAVTIYPDFIAPLFDKYSPLPEGELKTQIEALASSISFPLYKLYIVEGSVRSTHSNAYLYGFFKNKRIVLFDTLIAEFQRNKAENEKKEEESNEDSGEKKENEIRGCETDEIIAVLAHELGHWQLSHTIKNFLVLQAYVLINFVLFAQLLHCSPLYEAFGFTDSKPVLVGLNVIMSYVLAPVGKLLQWMMTIMSRTFEFQADNFALKLGHAEPLKRALVKLHKDNLGYPIFDWLYSNWHHSHPPLLERLDALKKDD